MQDQTERIDITTSCSDSDYIPKVANAGGLVTMASGTKVQVMHNGVKVLADMYYGSFITEIIEKLKGHHEPQEEKVFHEILPLVPDDGVMIELGAYWGYYSLWFLNSKPNGKSYLAEPETENIAIGKENFKLNEVTGVFEQCFISGTSDDDTTPPTRTLLDICDKHSIDKIAILHSDIQGYEFEMLNGAGEILRDSSKVQFIFVSTHSLEIHDRCLKFLADRKFSLVAAHSPQESYSGDGLVVVTSDERMHTVEISARPLNKMRFIDAIRVMLYRLKFYRAMVLLFPKKFPFVLRRFLA